MSNYAHSMAQIHNFILVAELGGFTKAARELGISNTAVSKNIKNLEIRIGKQLFARSTRAVKLTEFGKTFLVLCKQLDKKFIEIEQFIESRQLEPQGYLKVLVSTVYTEDVIMPNIKEFLNIYPKVQLEVIYSEELISQNHDDIDIMLGFTHNKPHTDHYNSILLVNQKFSLYASCDYVEKFGNPTSEDEFLDARFVSHSHQKHPRKLELESGNFLLSPEPYGIFNFYKDTVQACVSGLGIIQAFDDSMHKLVQEGRVVQVMENYNLASQDVCLFYRASNYQLTKVKAFIDFYAAQAKQLYQKTNTN